MKYVNQPNSVYWRNKLRRDFGITRIPKYWRYTVKEMYDLYSAMPGDEDRLTAASGWGQIGGVRKFLNEIGEYGTQSIKNLALLNASGRGHLDVVRLLLENGADVNAADISGNTALMRASENGHTDVVRLLLEKGVDVNAVYNHGETALMRASAWGHLDAVRLLLEKGADVNAVNDYGETALMLASREGHLDVVKLLETYGAKS